MKGLSNSAGAWNDALLAAALISIDPHGLGGVHLRARFGPARERWLEIALGLAAGEAPISRIPAAISEARLCGGLDIGMTLDAGRPIGERGVLAAADGGIVIISMAERIGASVAAIIGAALDDGAVRIERDGLSTSHPARFALIALDEGDEDETLPAPLRDRLSLHIDLDGIGLHDIAGTVLPVEVSRARDKLHTVSIADGMIEALSAASFAAGARSLRTPLHLVRAARAIAALRGSEAVDAEDGMTALRLVLGIGDVAKQDETQVDDDRRPPEPEIDDEDDRASLSPEALRDMLIAATEAALPKDVLERLSAGASRARSRGEAGKAGAARKRARRGRIIGTSDRPSVEGARIDVLATLRQAAPWQRLRSQTSDASKPGGRSRLRLRKTDFRYPRFLEKTGTTAIFAVDASGSAAVERLAETKGAVELLLAECYVRRDQVAMIAFRGRKAEILLEPTRSLVRAKRSLAQLPGGGGTPLAGGIMAALAMAKAQADKGQSVLGIFLTDGRGNVGLDGATDKSRVDADTKTAARAFRASGIRSILIDTAQRPQARAAHLARELGAEYLPLPRGAARAVAREIGTRMEG